MVDLKTNEHKIFLLSASKRKLAFEFVDLFVKEFISGEQSIVNVNADETSGLSLFVG